MKPAPDLSTLALQLAVWGVTDAGSLPWLDIPPAAHLAVAQNTLQALGAVDAQLRPTALGREMAALPLAPRTARLLLWGRQNSLLHWRPVRRRCLKSAIPFAHTAAGRKVGAHTPRVRLAHTCAASTGCAAIPHPARGQTLPVNAHAGWPSA